MSTIFKFNSGDFLAELDHVAAAPAPAPVGSEVSQIRSKAVVAEDPAAPRAGVWESTPGRWRRQVVKAEFCVFLSGDCNFTPDGGEPIEVQPGDTLYFPANSLGIWDIRATSRKIFIIFDEAPRG